MKIMLDEGAYMPVRAHKDDAGLDLRSPIDIIVPARGSVVIDTGVHVELPKKTTGFLKSKSGLNVKYGITSEGVIDVNYTGSIRAKLYNHGDEPYMFLAGDKITQLVILPIVIPKKLERVETLDERGRGNGGFGSSGR
jgi:dUTP pyrophosphatase